MSHKDGDQTTSTTWAWQSKESLGSSTGWPGVEVPILSCKCKSCKNRKKCKIAMVSEFGWPSTKQIDDNHVSWIFFIGFTDRQVPVNKLLLDFLQFIHLSEIHFGYFSNSLAGGARNLGPLFKESFSKRLECIHGLQGPLDLFACLRIGKHTQIPVSFVLC